MRQIRDYQLLKEIGSGMFSTVFLCKNMKTNQIYACKMFEREKMTKRSLKNLHDEIQILKNLDSPFIIKLYETFKTKKHYYLILEYCNGQDLDSLLDQRLVLVEKEVKYIFTKVVSAMQEMHRIRALHRDIKNANILLHFPRLTDI